MKKLYWRPSKVSWKIHVLIAILAMAGMAAVEAFKTKKQQSDYQTKLKAANLMRKGMEAIRTERVTKYGPISKEIDPTDSGMIGRLISPITSLVGHLAAKRTTVNPNWAAVMVELLRRAGASRGDVIAAGFSGSFPALNLAVMAAAESMKLKVVAISSASASAWGANFPELTWLDMERLLQQQKIISQRSVAASLGGLKDRAVGMSDEGRQLLRAAIARSGARFIEAPSLKENLDVRMSLYREFADGKPIVVYVNVGGGTMSVGSDEGKRSFKPGLNRRPPRKALQLDGMMTRFAKQGVPVIHISNVNQLAKRYGLERSPKRIPTVGTGGIFEKKEYNDWLVVLVMVLLVLALYAFVKIDIGYRIFSTGRKPEGARPPEQMV